MQFAKVIDDAVLPNIQAALAEFNASLPPDPNGAPGAKVGAIATPAEFLGYQVDQLIRTWVRKFALLPVTPATDPNAVPARVPRKQGLKALARADQVGLPAPIYEADILARINGLPETTPEAKLQKVDLLAEFQGSQDWIRGNQYFEALRQAMGISPDQSDALLRLAASLPE